MKEGKKILLSISPKMAAAVTQRPSETFVGGSKLILAAIFFLTQLNLTVFIWLMIATQKGSNAYGISSFLPEPYVEYILYIKFKFIVTRGMSRRWNCIPL